MKGEKYKGRRFISRKKSQNKENLSNGDKEKKQISNMLQIQETKAYSI